MEAEHRKHTGRAPQPLFAEEGLAHVAQMAGPGLLCAFDFDGTLAPIVPRPEQARLPDHIRERLVRLQQYVPVAIITGRSVSDILPRLGFRPDHVIGNHGLEGVPGAGEEEAAWRAACAAWRRRIEAAGMLGPGMELEDKGLSLSLHYRLAPDPAAAEAQLRRFLPTLSPPPHVIDGKCVFNLLPADDANKGRALERLMHHTGASGAVYVGDDTTDEDVFRLQRPDLLSIRIERHEDSAAAFYLPQPDDIDRLLDLLVERLRRHGARRGPVAREG